MKVAVASMGTVPEALVGIRFGMCSQFLIFDLDTMEYVVLRVPPRAEAPDQVSLGAIRVLAGQGVAAVITGQIKDICRQTLEGLGIEVIDGVERMTVREAVELYRATGLRTPELRAGPLSHIAVVARGEGLEARLEVPMEKCTSFIVVDPATNEWHTVDVPAEGPAHEVNLEAIRAIVRSGAGVLITPRIHPECCAALQALAVAVVIAPEGLTVREAIQRYEAGELVESRYAF
jgi:predicted Fe-Mo cluster-binding NifX family protein